MLYTALLLTFPLAMAFAAIWDVFTLTIPNRLCLALAGAFIAAAVLAGLPPMVVATHLACGIGMLIAGFVLFNLRVMGGGDAKLMAVVALWIGATHLGQFVTYMALAGGALAIVLLLYRVRPLPMWLVSQPWALQLHDRKGGVPYGVAIAAGALVVFPSTTWFANLA